MARKLVYITASGKEEAARLAKSLVSERLVACANIYAPVISVFWWEGEAKEEDEAILFAKTDEALVPAIIERVKELHSYDCPCVVALPLEQGLPEFLDWIGEETAEAAARMGK